jgi:hypothetical protein
MRKVLAGSSWRLWPLKKNLAGRNTGAAAIVGNLDGIQHGRVYGWVAHQSCPTLRLTVEAVSLSGASARALADRYRADVHKAGHGDGYSGFAISLGRLDDLVGLKVFCCDPRVELRPATRSRVDFQPLIIRRQTYVLHLDRRPPGAPLTGWATDWDCPERHRLLQLHSGARILAQRRATLFRNDIGAARSDGFLGFWLPPPTGPDVTITDVANGVTVPVSP